MSDGVKSVLLGHVWISTLTVIILVLSISNRYLMVHASNESYVAEHNIRKFSVMPSKSKCVVWDGLGFCRNRRSLIEHISDDVCVPRYCLYSASSQQYIDLSKLLNRKTESSLMWEGDNSECLQPQGGQVVSTAGFPLVSFIITIHNHGEMAAKSILETFKTAHEVESAEFIIVDDGTNDGSNVEFMLLVKHLVTLFNVDMTVITHSVAKGYGASNNVALKASKSEYSVLLNTDVFVHPGWLTMLMYTMQSSALRVGMVGPLMIGSDGKVSESGGFVQKGGFPGNLFRAKAPLELTQYNARVVDYISAASVLIRRKVFLDMGLFDPAFEPAYYEDTDAALTMMEGGYNVMVNPLAVVTHLDGGSYSSIRKKRLMDRNQRVFAKKHKGILEQYCPVSNDHSLHTFARQKNRILFLDDIVPMPDKDAGSIRAMNLLKILVRLGYSVTMEPRHTGFLNNTGNVLNLLADGVNVVPHGTLAQMLRSFGTKPGVLCPYKAIIVSRRDVGADKYAQAKKLCPHVPFIYDTVDVHFIREERGMNLEAKTISKGDENAVRLFQRRFKKLNMTKEMELGLMKQSNITYVVSTHELKVLQGLIPDVDVRIVSNIYDLSVGSRIPRDGRNGGVFVANICHEPNVGAVRFILNEIVNKDLPDGFLVHVVLSRSAICGPVGLMQRLRKHPKIKLHLDITNKALQEIHSSSLVVLAPLKYGAGVKGKVNYGLLHGTPVIGTTIACEGMSLEHKKNVYIADTGIEFANAVIDLSTNTSLWNSIQAGGFQVMSEFFGVDSASKVIAKSLLDLGVHVTDANAPNICSFSSVVGNESALIDQSNLFPRPELNYKRNKGLITDSQNGINCNG